MISRPPRPLKVLVTRPVHQAQDLCEQIRAGGGDPVLLPVLEIEALNDNLARCIETLDSYQVAIFISANAVTHSLPLILQQAPLPPGLQPAAVGKRTAAALAALGCPPALVPAQQFDSEGLLALAALQTPAIAGKRVVIFRGVGGRETLAETLRARGAQVDYVEVYRRVCPVFDAAQHPWAASGDIDAVIVTSGEGLHNLLRMLGDPAWLRAVVWVVISERLATLAQAQGVQQVRVAAQADDAGLVAALW